MSPSVKLPKGMKYKEFDIDVLGCLTSAVYLSHVQVVNYVAAAEVKFQRKYTRYDIGNSYIV